MEPEKGDGLAPPFRHPTADSSAAGPTGSRPAAPAFPRPSRSCLAVLWLGCAFLALFGVLWQTQYIPLPPAAYFLALVACALPLLFAEVRSGTVSAFLADVFASRAKTGWLLFLALCAVVKFYGTPGYRLYTMGDGAPHFLNSWMVYEGLRNGELPFWTNQWACGSPFLQFYPPLFFYLAAAGLFVLPDLFTVIPLLLSLLHLLSGVTLYRLVRSLGTGRGAAFVGALLYAMAPWHVFQLFHFNRFPVAPVYTLLPLLFLSTERLRRGRLQALGIGALSLAGIALSHQGYALFTCVFFALYTVVRSCEQAGAPGGRWPYFQHLVLTGLLGLGIASFLLVPHLLESHLLPFLPSVGSIQGAKGFLMDNPYLATLFLWSRRPILHSGYLGYTLFLFGLVGLTGWVSMRRSAWAALLVCTAFAYLLVLGHENPLYGWIPLVYSQFYAGRYIIFLTFFLSISAGLSVPVLSHFLRSRARPAGGRTNRTLTALVPRLPLIVLLVAALDLGPIFHYVQRSPRYATPDQGRVYDAIREARASDPHVLGRAVDLPRDYARRNHGSLILPFEADAPTPEAGQFGTTRSYHFIRRILREARENLPYLHTLADPIRHALFLLNTRYLFTDAFSPEAVSALGGRTFGGPLALFRLPEASPVLASHRLDAVEKGWGPPARLTDLVLDRWNPPDLLERLLASMDIDPAHRTARRILVRDGPPLPAPLPGPVEPIRVEEQEEELTRIRLAVTAGSDCFLRLSQSYYPYQRVLLDGHPVERVYRSAMDFIVIPFPAGRHRIEVQAVLSPLRKGCLAASAGALAITLLLGVAGSLPRGAPRGSGNSTHIPRKP